MDSCNSFTNNRSNVEFQIGQQNNYESNNLEDLLPRAKDAAYSSYTRQHDPKCLENTRVDLLEQIRAWITRPDARHVFWLTGMAGTGKSTIARTVCDHYDKEGSLGASFFFSRDGSDVSNARLFFTTIAAQMARQIPHFKYEVMQVLRQKGDIVTDNFEHQWIELIAGPLSNLNPRPTPRVFLIVVDALDECDSGDDITLILRIFAGARSLNHFRIRVLLTSRPADCPISSEHFVLHDIERAVVDRDIELFLSHKFRQIRETFKNPSEDWPGQEIIHALVIESHGLFIYAATICRFISENTNWHPHQLLNLIISRTDACVAQGQIAATQKSPMGAIDKLYMEILDQSLKTADPRDADPRDEPQLIENLKNVVGTLVVLLDPLSTTAVTDLLAPSGMRVDVDFSVRRLCSVLDISPQPESAIRLLHPSFRDFLLDRERSHRFSINEEQTHYSLAICCLRLMRNKLKVDICGICKPGGCVNDIPETKKDDCIPSALQYACKYWIEHLVRSGDQRRNAINEIKDFLNTKFLCWLEALSIIGEFFYPDRILRKLRDEIAKNVDQDLYTGISDGIEFVKGRTSLIRHMPLQLYCTCLAFPPEGNRTGDHFRDLMLPWIRRPGPSNERNSLEVTFKAHDKGVLTIAISPDGGRVASGSYDKTVRLWSTETAADPRILQGHTGGISAVAFSSNGMLLASGSFDNTVRLWNTEPAGYLKTLQGHKGYITAVAFSPDGMLLASASHDKTVRVWDVIAGRTAETIKTTTFFISQLSFSPDGLSVIANTDLLELKSPIQPTLSSPVEPCSISVRYGWVWWEKDPFVEIPYPPKAIAVRGTIVAIGYQSGNITIMELLVHHM